MEFCWGMTKNFYRCYPLKEKRMKAKFMEYVNSWQEFIMLEGVHLFGRRIYRYILAYIGLETAKESQQTSTPLQASGRTNIKLPEMPCMSSVSQYEVVDNKLPLNYWIRHIRRKGEERGEGHGD